jgi:hypothetical protein
MLMLILFQSEDSEDSQQTLIAPKTDELALKEDSPDTLCISSSSKQSPTMLDSTETHDIESLAVIVNSDECPSQTMMVSIDTGNLDNASDPPSIVHQAEDEDNSIENQLNCVGVSIATESEIILSDPPVTEFQPISDS